MDTTAFASRPARPGDLPFIVSSFAGSYVAAGHVGGMHDRFGDTFKRPFATLVRCAEEGPDAVVSARVVFPLAEPTEIAGYAVFSPRHHALVYVLTKSPYQRRRVAAHLLGSVPTLMGDPRDKRPFFHTVFSTAEFARMCKACDIKTRYSPFLLLRIAR